MHEVSMVGTYGHSSNIYDACLEVDRNSMHNHPGITSPHSSQLPNHMQFSSSSIYRSSADWRNRFYKEFLAVNDVDNLNNARLTDNHGVRAII